MGDFNFDLLKYKHNNNTNRFIHQMYRSHFYPVINKPISQITASTATIIDNIFTNDIDVSCIDGILINDFLDHLLSLIAWDKLNYTYDVDYAIDTFRVHF